MKYEDLDCDGVRDSNEVGLPNWVMYATDFFGTFSATTNALGQYNISGLWTGLHYVGEVQQPGWVQTSPISLQYLVYQPAYNSILTGIDFGNMDLSKCDSIPEDTCLAGVDDNFAPGNSEIPTPSPSLQALMNEICQGAPLLNFDEPAHNQCFGHSFPKCWDTTCCIASGKLCMRLRATNPGSEDDQIWLGAMPALEGVWRYSLSQLLAIHTAGADTVWNLGDTMTICLDLGNLPSYGGITSVLAMLKGGKFDFFLRDDTEIDYLQLIVGTCCPAGSTTCSISGTKFIDKDRDGIFDVGESGMGGWTINLYITGGPLVATATTDAFGNYVFTNLPCTTYTVVEVMQPGWVQTYPSPNTHTLTLAAGTNSTGINFGNWRCQSTNDTCCVRPPVKMLAWYPLDETVPSITYDLAGNDNNGTQIGTFGFVPGKVAGGYQFGPGLANQDIVRVYNDPFVTIGPGDFSADVWIKPTSFSTNCATFLINTSNAPCVDPIFDNRQWFFGGSGLDGVSFFVQDDNQGTGTGYLGLVMSSFPTPQTTFLSPAGAISLNQWQHVAVTVSRSTGVGTFYLNGSVIGTFTPIAGPLYSTNAGPIMDIGHGTFLNTGSCYLTNRYFDGTIDELEIFNRVLTTSEVASLYQAGSSGKCKVRCQLPPVTTFCWSQTSRTLTFTICNASGSPASFNWSLAGQATGVGCNFNTTGMTFIPANGATAMLAAGQCVSVTVTVIRPAGFVPGNVGCFSLSTTSPQTGASATCQGQIKAAGKWCFILASPELLSPLRLGEIIPVTFTVVNDNDTAGLLNYRLDSEPEDMATGKSVVRLNGLPPGVPVTGQRPVGLGQSTLITVEVSLAEFEALSFENLVISLDDDGDGVPDRAGAVGIKPESFSDCNANGVDDATDITNGTSLDANGNGVPDECEATCTQEYCARCYVCGDANADFAVDISDAVYLIGYIFAGGPAPNPQLSGDANCDSAVDISDAVYLIGYIFAGGPHPCAGCK